MSFVLKHSHLFRRFPNMHLQYYVLARKYHPDKVGTDDKEAADKFKEVAEAYQVLSDAELRKQYDKEGRKGLSADKTEVAQDVPKVDPAILFAFLFGSDKFHDYVGRLATATCHGSGRFAKGEQGNGEAYSKEASDEIGNQAGGEIARMGRSRL